ncbi:LicD family protein [Ligilactobacillus ruminis]|uniref:LicD family protein n=1 Tax=Ligilactobacillus ruminis TaxID=1623 RepID=UPI0022E73213|nr:LicD family protein [Ligilactobacillus ruminis]
MQENNVEITGDLFKRIRTIDLEMLMEIDRICRKNNIKYSIMYGTLLGVVRHGGFIPWDDDCDVVFRRYEYEKFFEACKKDLDTDKFFLQDHRTDSWYLFGYGKLRRNGTVFKRTGQEHIRQHGGLFIDLFILDNIPNGNMARVFNKFELYLIRQAINSRIFKKTAYTYPERIMYNFLDNIPKEELFKKLGRMQKNITQSTLSYPEYTLTALIRILVMVILTAFLTSYARWNLKGTSFWHQNTIGNCYICHMVRITWSLLQRNYVVRIIMQRIFPLVTYLMIIKTRV